MGNRAISKRRKAGQRKRHCDNLIIIVVIINDFTKFKPVKENPTLLRESQLQRFLSKLKTNAEHLDPKVNSKIYPSGSRQARIYGLPKMHKPRGPNTLLPFRPSVSMTGTYNYKLAKYLCSLLQPYIPNNYLLFYYR